MNSYSYAGDNPINKTDTTGKAVGIDDAAGAIIGGLIGGGINIVTSIAAHHLTWGGAVGGIISGAIVGDGVVNVPETLGASLGISTGIADAIANGALGGASGNFIKQSIDLKTGDQKQGYNISEIGFSTAFEGATSGLAEGVFPDARIPELSAGRGNMNAVGKALETKMANGIINNISFTSGIKSAIGSQAANAYKTIGGAVLNSSAAFYSSSKNKKK